MKKQIPAIIGAVAVVLAIAGGLVWWQASQQGDTDGANTGQQQTLAGAKDACNYLTADVAIKLLGAGAEKGTGSTPVASDDISVSTCVYTSKTGASLEAVKNMRSATLLVRSPLTATGAASNDEPFDNQKTGTIKVNGYGEKAYWDPELGQLNVLKGGVWLIISLGKTTIADKSLDESKQLADLIVPQF